VFADIGLTGWKGGVIEGQSVSAVIARSDRSEDEGEFEFEFEDD
jgi:hypothetical protein